MARQCEDGVQPLLRQRGVQAATGNAGRRRPSVEVAGVGERAAGRLRRLEQLLTKVREHLGLVSVIEVNEPGEIVWMLTRKTRKIGVDVVLELVRQGRELGVGELLDLGELDRIDDDRALIAKYYQRRIED